MDVTVAEAVLPEIPLVDVGGGGPPALLEAEPERLAALIRAGRGHYGGLTLRLGDRATARWLARNGNPYRHEIAAVASRTAVPGAYLLNLSYEWSCTAGVGPDPAGDGNRMLRTLDWPMPGIGRYVVVARLEGDAGPYVAVTWPGYVGVLTAMAPGRFSAAINQPPMRRHSGSCWFDWAINRTGVWRRSELPPSHLLRRVFDTCRTYDEARTALAETPLCIPAFFTLSGTAADEGCTIERLEARAAASSSPACISNHWLSFDEPGRDRGTDSVGRRAQMQATVTAPAGGLDWLAPPVLNDQTRLAVVANAARGTLVVQGFEADGPATGVFTL